MEEWKLHGGEKETKTERKRERNGGGSEAKGDVENLSAIKKR